MEKVKIVKCSAKNNSYDLYVYGEIVSEKWFDDDVSASDFKESLDDMPKNSTLNMYIASPGGDVFVTNSIITMLKRAKQTKNIKIVAHIDSLAASCASFLLMIADEIIVYRNSILMMHKPWTYCSGNAIDFQEQIDLLEKLEQNIMIPIYLSKAKEGITEDKIKQMLIDETWMSASEIQDTFNVTYVDEEKEVAAKVDLSIANKYKNIPENLKGSFFNAQNKVQKPVMDEETRILIERINKKAQSWSKN